MMGWLMCLFVWLVAVAIIIVLKIYNKLTTGWCKSNVCLMGKTVIVTGGNSGIGYVAAEEFAKRGAKVILACRNENRGKEAAEKIIRATDNVNVVFKQLDLCSFKSVKAFAMDINRSEERLDILVNNAGIAHSLQHKTEDGLNCIMQANYFGHFLLTNLLLDLLKKTPNARIVNVASIVAKFTSFTNPFDVNSLNDLKDYQLYAKSKLFNILFTIELADRLRGTTGTTYSLHPGLVLTNIFSSLPAAEYILVSTFKWLFKDAQEGAQTTIHCSVCKDIESLSGQHFHDCHVASRYQSALDPTLPKKLWKYSEDLVKLNQE